MAVGDNAQVDVRGANRAGWASALVLTGVYQPGDDVSSEDTPDYTHANVLEVVEAHLASGRARMRGEQGARRHGHPA
jgi:ribonucleotide monophosphatase NagD (HAD superfamily)